MSELRDIVSSALAQGDPNLLCAAIPYSRFVGMSMELVSAKEPAPSVAELPSAGAGIVRGTLRRADMLVGNPRGPYLHGGIVGALLESTAIFQLLWTLEMAVFPKIVNVTIHYLRPGRLADTHAKSTITRLGRRVTAMRSEAWQDDPLRPIAVAEAQFLIPARA